MRRLALASCAVLACAHQSVPPSVATEPARLLGCSVQAPKAVAGSAPAPDMSADFQIDARGKVRDVHVQGGAAASARALRRHLESCQYSPATKDGNPIATRRAAVYGGYR